MLLFFRGAGMRNHCYFFPLVHGHRKQVHSSVITSIWIQGGSEGKNYQFQNARNARVLDWRFVLDTLNHLTIGHNRIVQNLQYFHNTHQTKQYNLGILRTLLGSNSIIWIYKCSFLKARANVNSMFWIEITVIYGNGDLGLRCMGFRREGKGLL